MNDTDDGTRYSPEAAGPPAMERPPRQGMTRRRFLTGLGAATATAGVSYLLVRGLAFREEGSVTPSARPADPSLEGLADNIVSGGPPKDGIPSIDRPRFVAASDAGFLSDEDVVFGLVHGGEVRAYPQLVLVWHEIVNDRFPDGPMSVTYCPLTGSTVAFRGTAPGGKPYTFGTSGDLVNSNLLMYDRQTDSRWPQILGRGILGPGRGERLEEIPLDWTTWGRWRAAHPDTVVLTTDTGYIRDYGQDPYGSYTPLSGYYERGSGRFFPVTHEDDRFDPKEVMVGAKLGNARLAVRKGALRRSRAVGSQMAGQPVALLYDEALGEGRAFLAKAGGRSIRLSAADERGRFIDARSRSVWDATGRAVAGPLAGTQLPRIVSYDVMWFSWVAFFPSTRVAGPSAQPTDE